MARKSKNTSRPTPAPAPTPAPQADGRWQWLTKPWAVVVAVGGALGVFFLNINPILSNVRQLPSEVRTTADQFSSWLHEDAAWNGYWTSSPDGYVDAEGMNLSKDKIAIELVAKNGQISGTIATPKICDAFPVFDFLLVRGEVGLSGKSANIVVWDTVLGHNVDFARIKLKRDGSIMSVTPKDGMVELFPTKANIAVDPSEGSTAAPICDPAKQRAFADEILKQAREQQH